MLEGNDSAVALKKLRSAMRSHVFRTAAGRVELDGVVRTLDARTRQDGFHVLLEWEQAAGRFSEEEVPVLMVDLFARGGPSVRPEREALAVLLDFYFLYVVALLVMRAWDEGDPNQNLDRVTGLLGDLQGSGGSGRKLVGDSATLLFLATSNFQPDDQAYHRLLEKVRSLDEAHRTGMATIGAAVIGTHLRWALSAIYERDLVHMRDDNFVDYPWLFFSVLTLMRRYARLHEGDVRGPERDRVVGALLNGLTPDPWAFIGKPPAPLAGHAEEHAELRGLFAEHRDTLLTELEGHLPANDAYSPISLQFNFPHNVLVAMVILGLLAEGMPDLPLDALLTRPASGESPGAPAELLARGVTGFAAANPERRGDRRVLPVVYNPSVGLRSFSTTLSALRKGADRITLGTPSD